MASEFNLDFFPSDRLPKSELLAILRVIRRCSAYVPQAPRLRLSASPGASPSRLTSQSIRESRPHGRVTWSASFFFCCKASDSRLFDHKHEPTTQTLLTDFTMKARVHNKALALLQAKLPPTNKKKTCSCPHTAMFEHEKKRSILVAYFALSFKIHLPPKMFRTPKCSAHSRSPNGRHIRHQKRHASSVASSDHDICGS